MKTQTNIINEGKSKAVANHSTSQSVQKKTYRNVGSAQLNNGSGRTPNIGKENQIGAVAQLVRASNASKGLELEAVFTEGRVSLRNDKRVEVAYLTYTDVQPGQLVSQDYIKVNEALANAGIAYLLIHLCAERVAAEILYLGGGSLSPTGALLASKFGFKNYAPKKKGKGLWYYLTYCVHGGAGDKDEPLLDEGNGLLNLAYQTQKTLAGGSIPPIKWLEVSTIRTIAAAKVKAKGWTVA